MKRSHGCGDSDGECHGSFCVSGLGFGNSKNLPGGEKSSKIMDENSPFYGWTNISAKKYINLKKDFYGQDRLIFENMQSKFKISREQVDVYAEEFWEEQKNALNWDRSLKTLSQHFYNWTKKQIEIKNNNDKNGKFNRTRNHNGVEQRTDTLKKADKLIDTMFPRRNVTAN